MLTSRHVICLLEAAAAFALHSTQRVVQTARRTWSSERLLVIIIGGYRGLPFILGIIHIYISESAKGILMNQPEKKLFGRGCFAAGMPVRW